MFELFTIEARRWFVHEVPTERQRDVMIGAWKLAAKEQQTSYPEITVDHCQQATDS